MEKRHCIGKGIFALLVAAATLAGCTKDSDSNDTPTPTPPEAQGPYKEWPIKPVLDQKEKYFATFYTQAKANEAISLRLSGNGWIDLNNNGKQDEDEKTEAFDGSEKNYTIKSQVFTIYGKFTSIEISNSKVKNVDLSSLPDIENLYLSHNQIDRLDFSQNKKLDYVNVKHNALSAEAMLTMAKTLPKRKESEKSIIYLKNMSKHGEENDKNKVTKKALDELIKLNWVAKYSDEKGNDRNYEENLDQLDPDPSKN